MNGSIRHYLSADGKKMFEALKSQDQFIGITPKQDHSGREYIEINDDEDRLLDDLQLIEPCRVTMRLTLDNEKSFITDGRYNRDRNVTIKARIRSESIGEGYGEYITFRQDISVVGPNWLAVDEEFRLVMSDATIQPDENWECRHKTDEQSDRATLDKIRDIIKSVDLYNVFPPDRKILEDILKLTESK